MLRSPAEAGAGRSPVEELVEQQRRAERPGLRSAAGRDLDKRERELVREFGGDVGDPSGAGGGEDGTIARLDALGRQHQ